MFSLHKAFTGICARLSVGYRFRERTQSGMKCLGELGSILRFPDGGSSYQSALAETQLGNERKRGKKK